MENFHPWIVLDFFSTRPRISKFPFRVDMHSHLLPGLDDGVKTLEESKAVIQQLQTLGYEKLITTPHIMTHSYNNSPTKIGESLQTLKAFLVKEEIHIEVEAAAEYYLDEIVIESLETNKPLLTFGNRYLLFESNYVTEPYVLKEFIFRATAQGYKPVLAHPERYHFLTLPKAEDLYNRGVLFQLNLLSLTGYYSKPVQRMAEKFIENRWVSFLGSDCHSLLHAKNLENVFKSKAFKKALDLPLLNSGL